MNRPSKHPINPLAGAAWISAVHTAAQVANEVCKESNPHNNLLMHATGPNIWGATGSDAAGVLITIVPVIAG